MRRLGIAQPAFRQLELTFQLRLANAQLSNRGIDLGGAGNLIETLPLDDGLHFGELHLRGRELGIALGQALP